MKYVHFKAVANSKFFPNERGNLIFLVKSGDLMVSSFSRINSAKLESSLEKQSGSFLKYLEPTVDPREIPVSRRDEKAQPRIDPEAENVSRVRHVLQTELSSNHLP